MPHLARVSMRWIFVECCRIRGNERRNVARDSDEWWREGGDGEWCGDVIGLILDEDVMDGEVYERGKSKGKWVRLAEIEGWCRGIWDNRKSRLMKYDTTSSLELMRWWFKA